MVALDFADELEIEALDLLGGDGSALPPGVGVALPPGVGVALPPGVGAALPRGVANEAGSRLEVIDEVRWSGPVDPGEVPASHRIPEGSGNLVVRALEAAGRRAAVRLRKRIPAGAGLGGGSSDAAAVLRWAGVADPAVALRLGADVPFCLVGGRALVGGVGEIVEPLPFERATFLLCTPPMGVSTAAAYRAFDDLGPGAPDPQRRNDLEHAALAVEPRLALWRDLLLQVSGHRPQLAGSGSTWFVELAPEAGLGLVEALTAALRAAGARAAIALARATGATGGSGEPAS